ncbi:hypothetical protein HEB94_002890 [Actinopolymorpha pittospori]|uniref:Uncharacterized protein n=1 Tax=Actinopolymorpha pittospori TaxID=648752 RepID=A0A927MZ99_9ACTN|nr:hypothetical protein [Actinopolymorpha pittospori]
MTGFDGCAAGGADDSPAEHAVSMTAPAAVADP